MVARVGLCAVLVALSPLTAAAQSPGDVAERIKANVVRITSGQNEGFGLLVGLADGQLIVVTANHVLRSANALPDDPPPAAKVYFLGHPTPLQATVLSLKHDGLDLAVLLVAPPRRFAWIPDAFSQTVLLEGAKVSFVGRRTKWFVQRDPGVVNRISEINQRIQVEGLHVMPGSSGGPLISVDGVVGMVVTDVQGLSWAISLELIKAALDEWHLPFGLDVETGAAGRPVPVSLPPDTAATGGIGGDPSTPDSAAARNAAWPGLDNLDWVRFEVTKPTYLPSIGDALGGPDYRLIGDSDTGRLLWVDLGGTRRSLSAPLRASRLREDARIDLEIIEDDSPFGSEDVTTPVSVTLARMVAGTPVSLPIRSKFFSTYTHLDRTLRDIEISVRILPFDPESQSEGDHVASGAKVIETGEEYQATVSFNAGDATDYVRIEAGNGPVEAILWGTGDSRSVTIQLGSGEVIAKGVSNFGDSAFVMALRATSGQPLLLRTRVTGPGERLNYRIQAWHEGQAVEHPVELVAGWLRAESLPVLPTLGAVVKPFAEYFEIGAAVLTTILEVALAEGLASAQAPLAPPIVARVIEVVSHDLAVHTANLPPGAIHLPHVVTVLRGETGQVTSPTRLIAALGSQATTIVVRAIRLVEKLPDSESAQRALRPLVLDERDQVSRAAVAALRRLEGEP